MTALTEGRLYIAGMLAVLLFACVIAARGEDAGKPATRRLVSIHLSLEENKLSWTYAEGHWEGEGKAKQFFPSKLEEYSIDLDSAVMSRSGSEDPREISRSSARRLRDIRDALVGAAADFTGQWQDADEEEKGPAIKVVPVPPTEKPHYLPLGRTEKPIKMSGIVGKDHIRIADCNDRIHMGGFMISPCGTGLVTAEQFE